MKLFWKLFGSVLIITAFTCSAGVFLMVDGQYRASLSREMTAAGKENDTLRMTLMQEVQVLPEPDVYAAAQVLENAAWMGNEADWTYCLSDQEGRVWA